MGFFSGLSDALGVSDVFDTINDKLDEWTGQDWIGDLVATGGAIATGQWDEVAQHGLDLLEDGFEAIGWDEAAKWAKYGSELVDLGSDLYHGRYRQAIGDAGHIYRQATAEDSYQPPAGAPQVGNSATEDEISASGEFWQQQLLNNGSRGFMDALMNGDASAKAALKDPATLWMLQQTVKEENELITLVSNLLDVQHRNVMASVNNIRV